MSQYLWAARTPNATPKRTKSYYWAEARRQLEMGVAGKQIFK